MTVDRKGAPRYLLEESDAAREINWELLCELAKTMARKPEAQKRWRFERREQRIVAYDN